MSQLERVAQLFSVSVTGASQTFGTAERVCLARPPMVVNTLSRVRLKNPLALTLWFLRPFYGFASNTLRSLPRTQNRWYTTDGYIAQIYCHKQDRQICVSSGIVRCRVPNCLILAVLLLDGHRNLLTTQVVLSFTFMAIHLLSGELPNGSLRLPGRGLKGGSLC